MSRLSKPMTLARLEDLTIGSFAFVPSSETIDHLVRYLSTWSGSEFSAGKLFMIIQYTFKIIVPFLHLRARLQHRAGLRKEPTSSVGNSLAKLGGLFGDARMLANVWGLLPIIRWLTNLERNPPPTRKLLTIERLQGWAMLAYFPLEHLYYLTSHSVLPTEIPRPSLLGGSKEPIHIDVGAVSRTSTRLWAFYVLLQVAHLREDRQLLKVRERAVGKLKGPAAQAETEELKKRWDALWSEVVVNFAYLPLTLHWSLEKGVSENEVWVGLFGLVAALASWRSGWKATALPAQSSSEAKEADATSEKAVVEPLPEGPYDVDAQTSSDLNGTAEATS